ncbi:condensation domain-containing protein [Pendulispora brunnea]|uniref:Condensation domain-containing protein n=1 Tax=Pendulispora brunnea TaxID=2905690 RepID=A0ABZ2K2M4_9BACT
MNTQRRLCHTEKGLWKFDQAAPANTCVAARIRGVLAESALREGLSALRARHPYLRAAFGLDGSGEPVFQFERSADIPLRVLDTTPDGWLSEFEDELNDRFPALNAPFARSVWLRHAPDDHTVMLTVHHAASDGFSLGLAMRDLVRATARAASGSPARLEPLRDTRSVEERLPHRLWSRRGIRLLGRFVAEEARLSAKYGAPFKVPRDRPARVEGRRFRCIPRIFDESTTRRLLARAKAENTTVHGALAAAMILGAFREASIARPTRVALGSPINLREALVPPVKESLGYYVSMVPYRAAVDPHASFWQLARSIREQMSLGIARGDAPLMLDLFEGVFRLLRGHSASPSEIAARWDRTVVNSMILSNLGRQDFGLENGPLSVEAVYFCAAMSVLGDFGSVANTFRDRLIWTFIWAEPLIGSTRAHRLMDFTAERLLQALDEAS